MHKRLRKRFLYLAVCLLVALLTGTVGFTLVAHYPPFDAFYMTLTTLTTVGYQELHPLDQRARIFNSFLIFFGVTTMFFAIGLVTQTIIELELMDFFGKRRIKRMIDKMQDHYIVCGFGRVGRGAAHELQRAEAPFVVVDRNPERVERAMRAGMAAVLADSTRDETLREIGIARAKGLVAALSTDADNLFLILSAKALNEKLYVAARVAEEEAEEKLRRAGGDTVYAPYTIAGHRLANALLRPHVSEFLDFTTTNLGLNVAIEQVRVAEESELCSRSLRDLQLRRELGVIVLAIRKADGEMLFNPPAEAEIGAGDHLIVMGEPQHLRKLEGLLTAGV